ncbi:MAG: hypothetical protein ACRC10_04615 [Thermoguttaceae bacterium]
MAVPKQMSEHFTKENLLKSIFWVSCFLAVMIGLLASWVAISGISERLEDRKRYLEGQNRLIREAAGVAVQPNEQTLKTIKQMTEDTSKNVYLAWRALAKDQKKPGDIWSDAVEPSPNALPVDFLREVRSLKTGDDIKRVYLEQFANTMDRQVYFVLDKLQRRKTEVRRTQLNPQTGQLEIVHRGDGSEIWEDAERMKKTPRGGSGAGLPGLGNRDNPSNNMHLRELGNVYWKNPEILSLIQTGKVLESVEVWYMLEDLLIYDSLFDVINETNKEAGNDPNKAIIKEIVELKLGKAAAGPVSAYLKSQEVTGESGSSSGGGFGGGGIGSLQPIRRDKSSDGRGSLGGGSTGMSGGSQEEVPLVSKQESLAKALVEGRYVEDGKLEQFKRIPVQMKVLIDQRYVSDFLVNCADSTMPIDVLNVTITLNQNGLEAAQGRTVTPPYDSYTIPVEILGAITIFNSPDNSEMAEKFKEGTATVNATDLVSDVDVQKTDGLDESAELPMEEESSAGSGRPEGPEMKRGPGEEAEGGLVPTPL